MKVAPIAFDNCHSQYHYDGGALTRDFKPLSFHSIVTKGFNDALFVPLNIVVNKANE